MSIRSIDRDFHVTGQLGPDQIAEIARLGYKAVVCMRPDGEGFRQPPFAAIATAAQEAGVAAFYLPVVPGTMSFDQARELKDFLKEQDGPVLAYCASGQRCAATYEMAKLA